MNTQTLIAPDGTEMVVMTRTEYDQLVAALDEQADTAAYVEAKRAIAAGEDEIIPPEFSKRLLDGENPVRVWRELRAIKAGKLAEAAEISGAYLSEIETGKKDGSIKAMKKIAEVLNVTIDDLV